MKHNTVPTGLKRPSKGAHSVKNGHSGHYFQEVKLTSQGEHRGGKRQLPYKPGCKPAVD